MVLTLAGECHSAKVQLRCTADNLDTFRYRPGDPMRYAPNHKECAMMNMTKRSVAAAALSALMITAGPFAAALHAQAPAKSLKEQLVGSWQLISVQLNHTEAYGQNPQGFMSIDAGGHIAVIVLSNGEARNISYFGTYTVDDADSSMTLHVNGSSAPTADGREI
jgi:hypothetical protein